jgi:quercetin dioxygenase-like cupin family protein
MSRMEEERNHGWQLYKGPVKVQHLPDVRGFAEAKLQKHNLFTTERFFLDVYCLRPGQAQTPHAHAGSDKVYVVLEGRPTVELDGERQELREGDAVLCPAGSSHGLRNDGPSDARVLVLMTPPPEKT